MGQVAKATIDAAEQALTYLYLLLAWLACLLAQFQMLPVVVWSVCIRYQSMPVWVLSCYSHFQHIYVSLGWALGLGLGMHRGALLDLLMGAQPRELNCMPCNARTAEVCLAASCCMDGHARVLMSIM
jgi:hypothetical protein